MATSPQAERPSSGMFGKGKKKNKEKGKEGEDGEQTSGPQGKSASNSSQEDSERKSISSCSEAEMTPKGTVEEDEEGGPEKKAEDTHAGKNGEAGALSGASGEGAAAEAVLKKAAERQLTSEEHARMTRDEFIKTEESYIQNLDILLNRYVAPLRQAATSDDEGFIISTKEVDKIFSRELSMLYTMHSQLLKEIREANNTTSFVDAFVSFVPYLKTYTLYVNNFVNSNKALMEYTKSNPKLQKFIQDTHEKLNREFMEEAGDSEKLSENQTQVDLRALLIMPIQRLPRYELLLRDLAKRTTDKEVDQTKLEKLLKDVQKVNHHINEAKRKDENTSKLVEIQNAIKSIDKAFTLFDRMGRKFVREGSLEIRELIFMDTKKVHFIRGYVFLFDDLLVLTKPKKSGGDTSRIYSLVDAHPLAGFTVSVHFEPPSGYGEGEEKDRIISLVPIEKEKKTVQLKATTTNERQNWLEDISHHIHHALQRALGVPSPNVPHKNADA